MYIEVFNGARKKEKIEIDDEDYEKIKDYNWEISKTKFSSSYFICGYKKGNYKKIYYLTQLLLNTQDMCKYKDGNILNNKKINLEVI